MNPLRGIVLKILSVVVFMAMASIVKAISNEIPPGQIVFFRSLFAIPPIVLWLWSRGQFPASLRTQSPLNHVWRSLVGVCGMGLGFLALGLIPLPESVAIGYAAPLLTTIFAAMFLGEPVRLVRLAAVVLGLVGVGLVLAPRISTFSDGTTTPDETLGAFAQLIAAVFVALATVFVRKLVQVETTAAIVFYFSAIAAGFGLLTIPFGWVAPTPLTLVLLVLTGVLGGLGQILMTESYRHAETSVIAPFEYTSMLLALGVGYFVFAEVPTGSMLGGATLIVCAGLLIIWRERQLGIRRARARKAMTPQG